MKIEATEHALEFIAGHGGKLYVWSDEHDFGHAKPTPPDDHVDWVEYPEDGFTLYQDSSIGEPDWWKIEFHHLPLAHVTALWDGGLFGRHAAEQAVEEDPEQAAEQAPDTE